MMSRLFLFTVSALFAVLFSLSCTEKTDTAAIPVAEFSYAIDSENTLKVVFADESSHAAEYLWDFGDGTGTSQEQHPTYTYLEGGNYTVTLKVYNTDGILKQTEKVLNVVAPEEEPADIVDPEWELDFEENFDGDAVNTDHWAMYHSAGHVGNGLRRPEAFSVADGLLTVTAQMKDGQLVSGGMAHAKNYKYGKFEVRVRADDDPNKATSAVLLTWPQSERWPMDGENDFYETTTNRRESFHTYIHYHQQEHKQHHKEHRFDAKEWHVVAMEWVPNFIKIYVDGELQWTLSDKVAIPDVPHHLCIQLDAFAKTMSGSTTMQVDWVKIYKLKN